MRQFDRKQFLTQLGALGLTAPLGLSTIGNRLLHSDNRDLSDPHNRIFENTEIHESRRDNQSDSLTCVKHVRVISSWRTLHVGAVIMRGDSTEEVTEGKPHLPADSTDIDAGGKYVAPGFIDLHVHGGGDADFVDGD